MAARMWKSSFFSAPICVITSDDDYDVVDKKYSVVSKQIPVFHERELAWLHSEIEDLKSEEGRALLETYRKMKSLFGVRLPVPPEFNHTEYVLNNMGDAGKEVVEKEKAQISKGFERMREIANG